MFRSTQGMSQVDLASRLGEQLGKHIDPTTITRMERGTRPTSVVELYALATIFGVQLREMLPGTDKRFIDAAAFELRSTEKNLRRERILTEARMFELNRDIDRVTEAAEAGARLAARAGGSARLPAGALADLEVLARLGFGGLLDTPFPNIFGDVVAKDVESRAIQWANRATVRDLGLEDEDLDERVVYYLALIEFVRREGVQDASEA